MSNDLNSEICKGQYDYFERLNYYFGKIMTVRDFKDNQNYFNEKRWILNRFGIGWGVVCGLKVMADENSASNVIVMPGFAIDKNGNEIMICQKQTVNLDNIGGEPPQPSSPGTSLT